MKPIPTYTTEMSNLIKDHVKPTQHTGNFGTHSTYRGREPGTRLQPLFHQMTAMILKATDDSRYYTVEIKIVTNITVDPSQAKIGEHVHHNYFELNPIPPDREGNQALEVLISNIIQKHVFQPTHEGYQRIE